MNASEDDILSAVDLLKNQFRANKKKGISQVCYVYYTGHGVVLANGSGNSMIKQTDTEGTTIDFEKKIIKKLLAYPNTEVFGIFDACRTEVKGKGGEVKKLEAASHILYAS